MSFTFINMQNCMTLITAMIYIEKTDTRDTCENHKRFFK